MQIVQNTVSEQALALKSSQLLKKIGDIPPHLVVQDAYIPLPTSALPLLIEILEGISAGQKVSVTRPDMILTTQQAATLLGVSRPWCVHLLESGTIPFHRTGKHRRVRFVDIQNYQAKQSASKSALLALTAQAQQYRMGYE